MTRESTPPSAPLRRPVCWLLGLGLVLAVIFAYQPAWDAGFIWDDDDYVTRNPLLTAPDGLERIWFSTDSPSQYFPLVYTTFRIEHALWGFNPAGYHWVNILLHAVNALLVWRLLWRLRIPGAWLGAAIFALHPVQVESVAWVTELKNVQSLFFMLLSLLAWVEFLDRRRASWWYAAALIACQLALFSKTTACTLPAALVLILWWRREPITLRRWLQIAPFVVLGFAMGLVSIWWEKNHQGTVGETYHMSLLERVLVASRALWFYVGKFLWPSGLTFNYPLWRIDAGAPLAYAWLAALAVAGGVIVFLRRRLGRGPEVALAFYVATLSPLLGFVMLYTFRYTFVTDHYQYVALIGPAALAGAVLHAFAKRFDARRLAAAAAAGAVLLALGVASWRQARMYENLETLWTETIARNPDSYMGHNNLGAIYLEQGKVDMAIERFEDSLRILPGHASALYNLGRARFRRGESEEAIRLWHQVLAVDARDARAHSDLSLAFLVRGEMADALRHARAAVEIQPDYAEAQNNLGAALLQTGDAENSLRHFERATQLAPAFADAQFNLGAALLHLGRFEQSIAASQQAVALRPDFIEAHNNLAAAFLGAGRLDEGIARYSHALELEPRHEQVRSNLALALLQAGRAAEAIEHFQRLAEANPASADVRYNLALALFQSGRAEEALLHFAALAREHPENVELGNNFGWALLQTGRVDEAVAQFQAVLRTAPDAVLAHSNLALAHLRRADPRAAISHYEALLALEPDHAPSMAAWSWLLSTWPDEEIRDGARALQLAERANELSGGEQPGVLRSLAAAYAERGRYEDAVRTAERALLLAENQMNAPLAETLPRQIKLYRAGLPFRQSRPELAVATPLAK